LRERVERERVEQERVLEETNREEKVADEGEVQPEVAEEKKTRANKYAAYVEDADDDEAEEEKRRANKYAAYVLDMTSGLRRFLSESIAGREKNTWSRHEDV
jgi:hypothetical protein